MNIGFFYDKIELMNIHDILPYAAVFASAAVVFFFAGRLTQKIKDSSRIKKEREDAVKRSRAVLGGQFAEQLAPFLPGFPCNPGDAHFLGKPVDFVAFPGSAENREVNEILFIEVKSGSSALSEREKQIRTACEKKSVRYVEYRIPE